MNQIKLLKKTKVSTGLLKEVLLFIYLTMPLFNSIVSSIFSLIDLQSFSIFFCVTIMMLLYTFLCVAKERLLGLDFWLIYFLVIAFFLLTIIIHPEYEYWYAREDYGVINYVLRPDNGIFIFLFIRLLNDPKKIIRVIKVSAWFMFLYYGYAVMRYLSRGYWIDTSHKGIPIHMSYNLSLGYNLLIFVLPFIYCAMEEKKVIDIVGALIGTVIIMIGGSRGPFLDIAILIVCYILIKVDASKHKALLVLGVSAFAVAFIQLYPYLLYGLSSILDYFHITSRFVEKLASGSITEDAGRSVIWSAAIKMIKDKPLGHGAMGSRYVLSRYIYVAHPHQIFLEILIDFGVIIGSLIIIWMVVCAFKLFKMKGQEEWKKVFAIFFARACQLLVSLTFWHSIGLWGVLAVGICMWKAGKRGITNGG